MAIKVAKLLHLTVFFCIYWSLKIVAFSSLLNPCSSAYSKDNLTFVPMFNFHLHMLDKTWKRT